MTWQEEFDKRFPSPDGQDFIGMERISELKAFTLRKLTSLADQMEGAGKKEIIDECIEGTPVWYKTLIKSMWKSCPICGIDPENMKELAEALSEVREAMGKIRKEWNI